MRLTPEVLLRADASLNAYRDRELNLRGLKIPVIENLAVLQDQFDVIDFSDNEIKKLDNFPVMKRLSCLLLHNNAVTRIGKLATSTEKTLPNLSELILTNNRISSLSEISVLASSCGSSLKILSLIDNAVVLSAHYRMYTIYKIPSLVMLDFKKITKKEKEEANKFFATSHGTNMIQNIENERQQRAAGTYTGISKTTQTILTDEQKAQVKQAIEKATTKEQVDYIEKQLKSGNFDFLLSKLESNEESAVTEVTSTIATVDAGVVKEVTEGSNSNGMEVVEELVEATAKVETDTVIAVEKTEEILIDNGKKRSRTLSTDIAEEKKVHKKEGQYLKDKENKEAIDSKEEATVNAEAEHEMVDAKEGEGEEKQEEKVTKSVKKKTKAQLAKEEKAAAAASKKEAAAAKKEAAAAKKAANSASKKKAAK